METAAGDYYIIRNYCGWPFQDDHTVRRWDTVIKRSTNIPHAGKAEEKVKTENTGEDNKKIKSAGFLNGWENFCKYISLIQTKIYLFIAKELKKNWSFSAIPKFYKKNRMLFFSELK